MNASSLVRGGLVRAGVKPGAVPKGRKRAALAVALVADVIQLGLFPLFVEGGLSPFDGALDLIVALALTLALGWRWRTLLALGLELVPGLSLFPSWTAVVATLPVAPDAPALPPPSTPL